MLLYSVSYMSLHAIRIVPDYAHLDSRGYGNGEILHNGEYMLIKAFITNYSTVFDVGANRGEYSGLVHRDFPHATIYAFEPINAWFSQLRQSYPAINSHNIAIGDFDGEVTFRHYVNTEGGSGFFTRPILDASCIREDITVPVLSLDTFSLQNHINHIDFLKIDTEGGEYKVLLGAKKLLSSQSIAVIQFEYGGTYSDAGIRLKNVFDYLNSFNYSVFRICPDCLIHIKTWRDALENYQYSNYCAISPTKMKEII